SYVRVSRVGKRAHDRPFREFDLEVVVLSRDCFGQRDLGGLAKHFVPCVASLQEAFSLGRPPWSGCDPAQPKPRLANGVAVEIEDDSRGGERELVTCAVSDLQIVRAPCSRQVGNDDVRDQFAVLKSVFDMWRVAGGMVKVAQRNRTRASMGAHRMNLRIED